MNLYEFEGKQLFEKYGIKVSRGIVVRREDKIVNVFDIFKADDVVVKAQVLSGKRGKNNAIRFCKRDQGIKYVQDVVDELFAMQVQGQYVVAVRIEEKLDISEEHYLSITYDTNKKQPIFVYSAEGGVDIEEVDDSKIEKIFLDVRNTEDIKLGDINVRFAKELYKCFLEEDSRIVEINPLVKTKKNEWIAVDAKVVLDDDAFFRHSADAKLRAIEKGVNPDDITDWDMFESRTMLGRPATKREIAAQEIDKGDKYYQGTAGKYIELDGSIAVLFSGGGASIANMDTLKHYGLYPSNYTEYSGNPPREKVFQLSKIVLSEPDLEGLWICGGVANFTNVEDTFHGIVDALDEVKPRYPIVVRRAGPFEKEGMKLMQDCAERNNLNMKLFGKEKSMGETAEVLAKMINQ